MSISVNKLVIVESSAKAKTIQKFLDESFSVIACGGHIKQLDTTGGSVIINDQDVSIKWVYCKTWERLRSSLTKTVYDRIYIATDPDREGEKIAHDISQEIQLLNSQSSIHRIRFNSIVEGEVIKSINNPSSIDVNLVESAISRICLDYYLGYTLSPILWRKIPLAKSIGRVQAPALHYLANCELKLMQNPVNFAWRIRLTLYGYRFVVDATDFISMRQKVRDVLYHTKTVTFSEGVLRRQPPLPFNTADIQTFMHSRFGLEANKLMSILQNLYSGAENDSKGLISYIRTDSNRVNKEFVTHWLPKVMSLWALKRSDVDMDKVAQLDKKDPGSTYDAHECIRPTTDFLYRENDSLVKKIYDLIFRRTLAAFMYSSQYRTRKCTLVTEDGAKWVSKTSYRVLERGWERVIPEMRYPATNPNLHSLTVSYVQVNKIRRQSEGTLIKYLKSVKVGRPSTWQEIVPRLKLRGYISTYRGQIRVTDLGILVSCFMDKYLRNVVAEEYTSQMEASLDIIMSGQLTQTAFLCNLKRELGDQIELALNGRLVDALDRLLLDDKCCENKCARVNYFKNQNRYRINLYCKTLQASKPLCWKWISNVAQGDRLLKSYFDGTGYVRVIDTVPSNQGHFISKGAIYPSHKRKDPS